MCRPELALELFIHASSNEKKETGKPGRGQRRTANMADGVTAQTLKKRQKHDRFDVRLQQMVGWRDGGEGLNFKEECKVSLGGGRETPEVSEKQRESGR